MRGLIERIERENGITDLVGLLAEKLAPSELTSLLLEVAARQSGKISPGRVLQQYGSDRFVGPSEVDPRRYLELDRTAFSLLPEGYSPVELAPLAPLGSCSAVATVSQNKIVSTVRGSEVVSDPTNVLALECAKRRKKQRAQAVRLAASQRVVRAQALPPGPRYFAHFRIFSMVSAGRDEGAFRFESREILTQLAYYLALFAQLGLSRSRVAITPLSDRDFEAAIIGPLAERFPDARVHLDPDRKSGRGYYEDICFKLFATNESGEEMEVGDGGSVPWTRKLLSDQKERLLISGLGVERLIT